MSRNRVADYLKGKVKSFYVAIPTIESNLLKIEDRYIRNSLGIVHIGGHLGQEAARYAEHKCQVIWIEALPDLFTQLEKNIAQYPNQRAICALLGEENDKQVEFHLASNDLASSSIFRFGDELGFENLSMESSVQLVSSRLDHILTNTELADYHHWVIDVQGAELLVLKGAGQLLENCNSLRIEVSTRKVYEYGVNWIELRNYLEVQGFTPLWEPRKKSHEDIIFIRESLIEHKIDSDSRHR